MQRDYFERNLTYLAFKMNYSTHKTFTSCVACIKGFLLFLNADVHLMEMQLIKPFFSLIVRNKNNFHNYWKPARRQSNGGNFSEKYSAVPFSESFFLECKPGSVRDQRTSYNSGY